MEKTRQAATFLILAIAATWLPNRLARELSQEAFSPDYYSSGPLPSYTEQDLGPTSEEDLGPSAGDDYDLGPIPEVDLGPSSDDDDDLETAPAPYNEKLGVALCWVELGERCRQEILSGYVLRKLAITSDCCSQIRDVANKPCWDEMFEMLGYDGPLGDDIKGFCSAEPIGINHPQ